jgi:hypothetical protein
MIGVQALSTNVVYTELILEISVAINPPINIFKKGQSFHTQFLAHRSRGKMEKFVTYYTQYTR